MRFIFDTCRERRQQTIKSPFNFFVVISFFTLEDNTLQTLGFDRIKCFENISDEGFLNARDMLFLGLRIFDGELLRS